MPRKIQQRVPGVTGEGSGSGVWWIREKIGRKSGAIVLYQLSKRGLNQSSGAE